MSRAKKIKKEKPLQPMQEFLVEIRALRVAMEQLVPLVGALAEASLLQAQNTLDSHDTDTEDELYEAAKKAVIDARKASSSYLQRKLNIGYARAAMLMDMLEDRGVIAAGDGAEPRRVLATKPLPPETLQTLMQIEMQLSKTKKKKK